MERALRLLLAWGFEERGLHTVVWWANRGNYASRKLAWRLGFAVEGTLRSWLPQRGELLDAWVGTLLAGDEPRPRHRWIDVPTIDSARLPIRLRGAEPRDVIRVTEGHRDEQTGYWLGGIPQPYSSSMAQAYLAGLGEGMASGSALHLGVAHREDDRLLGMVTLAGIDALHESAEIGYWTHPDERGRGVMTEAVRLAVRHALLPEDVGGLGLTRVLAHAALGNPASRAVLLGAGLHEAGVERMSSRTRDGLQDSTRFELLGGELSVVDTSSPGEQ
jgi:RimJ/RimL family protein N-acetyltransferase